MDRNKIIVVGVVLVVVIGVVTLIAVKRSSHCSLEEKAPEHKLEEAQTIGTSDYAHLVKFGGHLEYNNLDSKVKPEDYKKKFMCLNLDSIVFQDDDKARMLSLNADCATIQLTFAKGDLKDATVTGAEVKLTTPNGDISACTLSADAVKDIKSGAYKCEKTKTYTCTGENKDKKAVTVATLTLAQLQYELNGDKELHKKNEFAKSGAVVCT